MAENHIAQECALTTEATTDEPVSFFNDQAATDKAVEPHFATDAEADAYWRGVTHGIRSAGHEPGHPHMPKDFSLDLTRDGRESGLVSGKLLEAWPHNPHDDAHSGNTRAPRHDGWTPEKERLFIEALANSGVVADACRAARMSRDAAYAYRRRASGRAFALAWDGALLIARGRVSDDVMSRAIHGVIDRVYRNGELVAERHRYDNRLTMAVLARLDKQAEGLGENAPVARAVAHEFDRFLDLLPQGIEGAERFLAARFPPPLEDGSPSLPPEEPATLHGYAPAADTELARLARLGAYETHGVALPAEVDLGDLDPEQMESWTEDQLARAEFSGFLRDLGKAEWPAAVRNPPRNGGEEHSLSGGQASTGGRSLGDQPQAGGGGPAEALDLNSEQEDSETNGMCKLRKLYLRYHPPIPATPAPEPEADVFENCEIWEEDDGEWMTNFPPPPSFDGYEEGDPGDEDYRRSLTEAEQAAIAPCLEEEAAEHSERLAREQAARDRFFGFTPAPAAPPNTAEFGPESQDSGQDRDPRQPDASDESRRDDRPEAVDEATPAPEPSGPRIRLLN